MCQCSQRSRWKMMHLQCNIWAIFNVVKIYHLIVIMWGIFLTEHPSKRILWTVLLSLAINFLQHPWCTHTHTHTHNFHVNVTKTNNLNANVCKTSSDVHWYGAAGSTNTASDVPRNNTVTTISAYHNITQQPLKIQPCYVFTFCSTTKAH